MKAFSGVDESIFEEGDSGWIAEQIATHLEDLLGENWHTPKFIEGMPGVPECAKVILYCWSFHYLVAGNGLQDYLLNRDITDEQLKKTAWALRKIGNSALADRLEAGVLLAFSESAHFEATHDVHGFEGFTPGVAFSDLASVDKDTICMAGDSLANQIGEFAVSKKAELILVRNLGNG